MKIDELKEGFYEFKSNSGIEIIPMICYIYKKNDNWIAEFPNGNENPIGENATALNYLEKLDQQKYYQKLALIQQQIEENETFLSNRSVKNIADEVNNQANQSAQDDYSERTEHDPPHGKHPSKKDGDPPHPYKKY